ncbi:MAG: prepilin-type N-terminal cleavage/methylation domain-containing protein [Chromatiales bacterium]|jgi:general secretion pathway protein J|nr:prepilin-type N-terminal cleavage/methylation domain-containing protein [Chromatiales bacterium]
MIQRGFTLIEVLVALGVLALIGVAVANAVALTSGAVSRGDEIRQGLSDARVLNDYLRRQIALAEPRLSRKNARLSLWFDGDADTLSWVGELPTYAAGGGFRALQLSLQDGDLMLRYSHIGTDYDGLDDLWRSERGQLITVLEDVTALRFSYLPVAESGVSDWVESWRDRIAMPTMVRVHVSIGGEPFPDLDIRLRARGGTNRTRHRPGSRKPAQPDDDATAPVQVGSGESEAPSESEAPQ